MIIHEDIPDHRLIVGCTRDSQIHTGISAFQLLSSGLFDKMITKAEAIFMAACDVGDAWKMLAKATPIFGLDDTGSPCFVKAGIAVPRISKIEDDVMPATTVEHSAPETIN